MLRLSLPVFVFLVFFAAQAAPARSEIRALLIGANAYKVAGIPDLEGPGNDIAEVEKLVRGRGATDVTILRDEDVTRTRVETAFHALGLRAKPGDWIVFMYAGHGAQAEAAIKGVKKNDLDDLLVLPGLSLTQPDPANYITSADLRAWLLNYIPSNVQVLQMVDACHSGTLQRKIDPRAPHFRQRLAFKLRTGPDALKLTARPAPQFEALPNAMGSVLGAHEAEYLPNVIYVSAAQDDQFAQEAALPEASSPNHGVLTYNFLSAMSAVGADGKTLLADTNQDGIVSFGEMAVYLDTQTRVMTDQQQEPSIHFASAYQDRPVFAEPPAHVVAVPEPSKPAVYAASAAAQMILKSATSWLTVDSVSASDYVWDFPTGDVLGRTGDVVARNVSTAPALEGVIEKWATVEAVRPYLSDRYARIQIGPRANGSRYAPGAHVELSIVPATPAAAKPPSYVTIFNLASDGRVQLLYPLEEDGDGRMPPKGPLPILTTEAIAPFGTDHILAVFTPERPDDFRNLLNTVKDTRGSGRLVSGIKAVMAKSGAEGGLTLGEIFTGLGG